MEYFVHEEKWGLTVRYVNGIPIDFKRDVERE